MSSDVLRLIGVVLLMYFEIILLVVAYVMSSAYLGFINPIHTGLRLEGAAQI